MCHLPKTLVHLRTQHLSYLRINGLKLWLGLSLSFLQFPKGRKNSHERISLSITGFGECVTWCKTLSLLTGLWNSFVPFHKNPLMVASFQQLHFPYFIHFHEDQVFKDMRAYFCRHGLDWWIDYFHFPFFFLFCQRWFVARVFLRTNLLPPSSCGLAPYLFLCSSYPSLFHLFVCLARILLISSICGHWISFNFNFYELLSTFCFSYYIFHAITFPAFSPRQWNESNTPHWLNGADLL